MKDNQYQNKIDYYKALYYLELDKNKELNNKLSKANKTMQDLYDSFYEQEN